MLEETLKFFLHGNLGNTVMLKQSRGSKCVGLLTGALKGFYVPQPQLRLQISLLFPLQLTASLTPSGFLTLLHWPYQRKLNNLETVPDTKFMERPRLCSGIGFTEQHFHLGGSFILTQTLQIYISKNSEITAWKVNIGNNPTYLKSRRCLWRCPT